MNIRDNIEQHNPSKIWYNTLLKYINKSNFRRALDIGCGVSTFAFFDAESDSKIISIDIKNKKEIKRYARENKKNFKFIEISSDFFFEGNKDMFDIISIDGGHEYKQVKKDLENSWEICNKGGYIVCDDYGHKSIKGVKEAVDEFCKNNNVQKILENGKAILQKTK